MFKQLVESRWWSLTELACVVIGGALWSVAPSLGWAPLVIACLPWVIGLLGGRSPFRPTSFDLPLAVFVLTAAVGVWAAYNPAQAWSKFWLIVGAVLVYYALARQPKANLWLIGVGLGVTVVVVASSFLMLYDWQKSPVALGFVNKLGLAWMSIRPPVATVNISTDIVAGIMVLLIPFLVALLLHVWQQRRVWMSTLVAVSLGIVLIALLLTSEQGEWLVLGFALVAWLLWLTIVRFVPRFFTSRRAQSNVMWLILAVMVIPIVLLQGIAWEGRWELTRNTLTLIRDFAITGGGLTAFAGLYSRYILVIPSLFLSQSTNLLLDTAMDQGVFGLLALVIILVSSIWTLLKNETLDNAAPRLSALWGACLSSAIVLAIYGLMEDPFYNGWGTLFLFVPAGLAIALAQPDPQPAASVAKPISLARSLVGPNGLMAGLLVVAGLLIGLVPQVRSMWFSNLGAVTMARIEVSGFPESPRYWNGYDVAELNSAKTLFEQALALDPANVTANYRLGFVAALSNDNVTAAKFWKTANQADPRYRGVQKMLGYAYVWMGKIDEAKGLLIEIPEAESEMSTYSWWWTTQGQADRSRYALEMAQQLAGQ